MAVSQDYKTFIEELLSGFGPVSIRNMFGGAGVYRDGVMFALIAYETLYLKVDETTQMEFEAEGSAPFTYEGKERPVTMSYWSLPERLYEDPSDISGWAQKAYAIALKGKKASSGKKKKKKKPQSAA